MVRGWKLYPVLLLATSCVLSGSVFCVSAEAAPWTLTLADSVVVAAPCLTLSDLVVDPLPATVADIVLRADAKPGQTQTVESRGLLRLLVERGLAHDVRLAGESRCLVNFVGIQISQSELVEQIRHQLGALLPPQLPGAPTTSLDIEIPSTAWQVDGRWTVELVAQNRLRPGRNLIGVAVVNGANRFRFSAVVTAHIHAEVARVTAACRRDEELAPELFAWEWIDLAAQPAGLAVGRNCLADKSAACPLRIGELLRESDLKITPLVRQGDPVELSISRGCVEVTVRAFARQDGRLGQVITIRNDINGNLMTARVTGPGQVEWRR